MTKKIAVINDLSGFGRCSLTAAISVIAAMGVQPCPLPTAILSAQTGYPSYYCDDYTEKMEYIRREWAAMNVDFDGIYTGFLADEVQAEQILAFLGTFHTPDNFLIVDPIMGGDGKVHSLFTSALLDKLKVLCQRADMITPNLMELCLLADADYNAVASIQDKDTLMKKIKELASSLFLSSPRLGHVIVTGILYEDNLPMMGNLYVKRNTARTGASLIAFPYIGCSYSGTGDLFTSCLAAGIARGDSIPACLTLAGEFLSLALKDSVKEQVPRNDGVNYEKYLSMLAPKSF